MTTVSPSQLKELHETVKKHTTDQIEVTASVRWITNNDKKHLAIDTVVNVKGTKKLVQFLHREHWNDYEKSLKKAIDSLLNSVVEEVKKDKNSL